MLIESSDGNIIVDIKWKRLDINPRTHTFSLSSADLYQLYAYTRRYGVKRSIIIFPKVPGASEVAYQPLGPDGEPDKTTVRINFTDISESLRQDFSFQWTRRSLSNPISMNQAQDYLPRRTS